MKRYIILFLAIALTNFSCEVAQKKTKGIKVDSEAVELMEKIDAAGAYDVPDIELRTDEKYASMAKDVEPYRHVKPYKKYFLRQIEYTGSGRGIPEPENLDTVKIGFIGPIEPTVSVATGGSASHEIKMGVKMLQGCKLAIEHANAKGGYLKRNIPFELAIHNDNGLWGASGNEIIDMVYKDNCWAILGTIDGANSHIAIRVALKAEITMMNSGNTDPTFVETNIPWVFRCMSDDRQQTYLLADYMYKKLGLKRVGVIRSSSRYGRFGVREILDISRRFGSPVLIEMAYDMGLDDFSLHLDRLKRENLDAVVHWGNADDGARILNQMREMGMNQPFFACDRGLSDEFVKIAGKNAEGVVCAYPWNPTSESKRLKEFRKAFKERFNEEAETFAAHAYDGMNMLIWATQTAGLNKAKIRDIMAFRTKPWEGVTGDIILSAVMDDIGEVYLAKREKGKWNYYSRQELNIPDELPSETSEK
ncbi:MAG: amino acid ABC transporter substrate-binding protein [Planctomycetes bacterium]|nr:amino acid ABC transporter substrate-binding protein [Planctomycetota bacterium]